MAWSHRAYAASGIYAIMHLDETEVDSLDFQAWKDLDDGIANEDIAKIRDAGRALLDREQNIIMQPFYYAIGSIRLIQPGFHSLWVGSWMGGNYVPPGPHGKVEVGEWMSAYSTLNPILDIGNDNDPLLFASGSRRTIGQ